VEDVHEEMRKWKDSDGEEKLFLVGHLNHILRRTGMWRDEEEMTECGKEDCFENFSHGVNEDSQVPDENTNGLLGEVEHDMKDKAESQETVETPERIKDVVDNGILEESIALEEMRKLKNERRFENRSMVRQDDFKAWREKNPDIVRKFSRRKLIKAQGVREISMKIEDIIEEGKDPVSLGFL